MWPSFWWVEREVCDKQWLVEPLYGWIGSFKGLWRGGERARERESRKRGREFGRDVT